jgi:hypothetical protein
MSKTPTWDMVQLHFDTRLDVSSPFLLTLRDFQLLQEETKALRTQQAEEEVMQFLQKAGMSFGKGAFVVLSPLLGLLNRKG